MKYFSPAKLNLWLHITGKRADGYHNLQTVFEILSFGDTLTFELNDAGEINLTCDVHTLNTPDNLILRAANLLQTEYGVTKGCNIHLSKRIPMGAGLGGGSSNAATTLKALNDLWQLNISLDSLAELALRLGADVPVFIDGEAAWASGVGEQLTPIILPPTWYVVIIPPVHIETKALFQAPNLVRDSPALAAGEMPPTPTNVFQAIAAVQYPEIAASLAWLSQYARARLTGTGSAIFAEFDSQAAAKAVLTDKPETCLGFVATGKK